jgi:hypothetical protein
VYRQMETQVQQVAESGIQVLNTLLKSKSEWFNIC